MSDPGYGNQNGPYQPGSPYPTDPRATPPPAADPWAQPAASPFPATSGTPDEYAAPVSGAEYSVPGLAPQPVPPTSAPPTAVPGHAPAPVSAPPPPSAPPHPGVPNYGRPASAGYGPAYATGPIPTGGYPTAPLPGAAEVGPSAVGRPPGGRNRLVAILGAATAVLLVVGLTMSGLYIAKNGEQNDTQAKLTAAEKTIEERDSKVSTLEKDLTDTKTKLTNTEQQLDGTKDSLGTANSDKQIIAKCLKLVIQALDAIGKGDKAKTDSLIAQLDAPCTKAEKLLPAE
ncbi:hypothetical protein [Cryptosporangium japonicum]|uniref:Uncharacterized protein n=1 Tax=Cryptosporangium japonicum TaxID=80872 RepID=A0ABN0UA91_9ACTN